MTCARIVRLEPAGRFSINMDYFNHDKYGMLEPFKRRFIETFGPPRAPVSCSPTATVMWRVRFRP
jgi:hypothetical protein